ncbi:protein phosphatase 2C domain-containing protein [Halomicrobium salinisoli]|uniref:protein phosphatase 2C domain-containing protein n=1 Tax=Halomicrobium salinisoli TaxID=2878391 RepID=UPI001CF0C4B6|nr:protein phosphatase 2C domain-containing protein [Halomicrobium salinisoli]
MARYTQSDRGEQRERNEDHAFSFKLGDVFGVGVADGLGGHAAGQVASELASATFAESFQELYDGGVARDVVRLCFEDAEGAVQRRMDDDEAYRGMGTTLVAAVVADGRALVGNVGDSRAYLVTDGGIRQVTDDHAERIPYGSPGRRRSLTRLTQAVGTESEGVAPDVFELELSEGDALLLCSDGLTDELDDDRIRRVVAGADALDEAGRRLVRYANRSGGRDNVSVALYAP